MKLKNPPRQAPPILLGRPRDRRAVCTLCHVVIDDCEPFAPSGVFFHPKLDTKGKRRTCRHAGTYCRLGDEVEPFMRKRTRRATRGKTVVA